MISRIFLDTDTLINFLRGNSNIQEKVYYVAQSGNRLNITNITVYEMLKGLRYVSNKKQEQQFKEFLTSVNVFSLNNAAVEIAADIYAVLRKKGITIGDADILIASIVITYGGKLITNNFKHYQHIDGLAIENWS